MNIRRKKRVALLLAVVCFAVMTVGCGSDPVGESSVAGMAGTDASAVTTAGSVTDATATTTAGGMDTTAGVSATTATLPSKADKLTTSAKQPTTTIATTTTKALTTTQAPTTTATTTSAVLTDWSTGPVVSSGTSIKVLAIGNSYSVNAMKYLYELLKAGGYETVVLGNLYVAGCALETHQLNIQGDRPAYTYYRNDDGYWDEQANYKLSTALASEAWDVVTVQQASLSSGIPTSYGPLTGILDYLEENRPASHTKFVWHQTWAYQGDNTSQAFARYGYDQMTMYDSIVSAIRWKVIPEARIAAVIPVGTAIQNLRSSKIGDTLTSDGTHLTDGLGCYTASMTWYCVLTGRSVDTVTWAPDTGTVAARSGAVREAVSSAIKIPYAVTPSVEFAP